ncbi:hypothetical protein [Fulvivirga imtechensis]|uniref:hypothetical protein n=1 Tax=Fulvivirga imtechensis TaxID=881893 RepID=UPI0005913764|nr:hypothetical protein [Fulvivirga imtechensis]
MIKKLSVAPQIAPTAMLNRTASSRLACNRFWLNVKYIKTRAPAESPIASAPIFNPNRLKEV